MSEVVEVETSSASIDVSKPARMLSLDALRGFDMFWIAGVDEVILSIHRAWPSDAFGIVATQFEHAEWEGFAFYDLIFPLFVFLVGITTVFSLDTILEREGRAGAYKRIVRRFILLYLVALLYNGSFWQEHIRLIGVLQRIAWCYLFTSLLYCHLRLRGLVVMFVALLLGYWALFTFVPPPGVDAPTFEMHKNWANWLDKHYLPIGDMESRGWRNEGLLSTIPAIATCLLGVFAGKFLRSKKYSDVQKVQGFLIAGALLVAVGFLWGLQFPVIKRIWTSTYVLVAGGYSCLFLGAFYYIVDVRQWRRWATPFFWIGSNAILAYLLTGMMPWRILQDPMTIVLEPSIGQWADVFAQAIVPLGVIAIIYTLYRKKIYLRV